MVLEDFKGTPSNVVQRNASMRKLKKCQTFQIQDWKAYNMFDEKGPTFTSNQVEGDSL